MKLFILTVLFVSVYFGLYSNEIYFNNEIGLKFLYYKDTKIKNITNLTEYFKNNVISKTLIIYYKKVNNLEKSYESAAEFDETFSIKEKKYMDKGELGDTGDFSQNIYLLKLKNKIYCKVYDVFGRYDEFDKTFERYCIIYYKDYKIIITYYGNKNQLISSMLYNYEVNAINISIFDEINQDEKKDLLKLYNYDKDDPRLIRKKSNFVNNLLLRDKYKKCIEIMKKYDYIPEYEYLSSDIEIFNNINNKRNYFSSEFLKWYYEFDEIIKSIDFQ